MELCAQPLGHMMRRGRRPAPALCSLLSLEQWLPEPSGRAVPESRPDSALGLGSGQSHLLVPAEDTGGGLTSPGQSQAASELWRGKSEVSERPKRLRGW